MTEDRAAEDGTAGGGAPGDVPGGGAAGRLSVDRAACRGAGQCAFNAPDLFDQDEEEGMVVLLRAEPPPGRLPSARRAVDACPNRAIVLSEPE